MLEKATFAMGCFWTPDILFANTDGVTATTVGYTGGHVKNPTYEQVCSNTTGHAEVVQVEFDSEKISYEELLKLFWDNHNPTTMNKQGPDEGEQYRSALFVHSPKQRELAEASKKVLEDSGKWKDPIVAEIIDAKTFYPAEEYHQKYLAKKGLKTCKLL